MGFNLRIDSDTQLCISLSARPGGFGNKFHNFLYERLGLNFVYKGGTTDDLKVALYGVRALKIRGCGLSMPFKIAALEEVDDASESAREIGATNTIVNENGRLKAYNTDFEAVFELLKTNLRDAHQPVVLLGAGGVARSLAHALSLVGARSVTVVARNRDARRDLAQRYGFLDAAESPSTLDGGVLINATPVGMSPNENEIPFAQNLLASAGLVFDLVAVPLETRLVREARVLGKKVVSGGDVLVLQGAKQFELYTGVRPSAEDLKLAADFALGSKTS